MNHRRPDVLSSAMIVGIALTSVSSISFAAANTGGGPQKTKKQCKHEGAKCLRDCGHCQRAAH